MYDVVVAGSGPAGLSSAVYGARAMLNMIVVEKAGYSGGQIVNTTDIDNYLGMAGCDGFDMAMKFREHAERMGAVFKDDEIIRVESDSESGVLSLTLKSGDILKTKSLIAATGAGHAKLMVPGEEEYKGRGVSYCATCDGAFYKGKTVCVAGGGDVALEDAIYLSKMASKVYLIHRRDTLRGAIKLREKFFSLKNVEFVPDCVIESINGDIQSSNVKSVTVKNLKDESRRNIDVSGVFVAVGMKPVSGFLEGVVEMDSSGYIVAGENGKTSVKGIYAAGDVRTKELRQIVTAVADGANAVSSVEKYLMEEWK